MAIFQGMDYVFWDLTEIAITLVVIIGFWYLVKVGRDRKPSQQKRGQETVEYFGDLAEDRAPVPKFIYLTIFSVILFSIFYMFWTGYNGMGF